jgi:CDP-diacylglycerol--glycerol-3-phosphate 3-phosphatidyltransferase
MANAITTARFPLLALLVILLYSGTALARTIAIPLLILLLAMDTLDGIVARYRGETSLLGSVLDVASDRTVEQVLWIVLASLNLVPIAIPLIIIPRGILTDSIRSIAVSRGIEPFKMMRSKLGKFLVQSPIVRTSYSASKVIAFVGMTYAYMLQGPGYAWSAVWRISLVSSWIALTLCLLRGLPVIVEAPSFLRGLEETKGQTPRPLDNVDRARHL